MRVCQSLVFSWIGYFLSNDRRSMERGDSVLVSVLERDGDDKVVQS